MRWGPQAARGLPFLQAESLSWHILACHLPAVTLLPPRHCPAVALASALLAQCSQRSPCHPVRHGTASQRLRNQVLVAEWEHRALHQTPPSLPQFHQRGWQSKMGPHTGCCMGAGMPMRGSPLAHVSRTHQVLMGTQMPHIGCLLARGSLVLGSLGGTGVPHRISTSWARSSPVPGAYRHGDRLRWARHGHRNLLCQVLYRHRGSLALGTRVPPSWAL